MADRLDLLLKDYFTGMLDVKINSRIQWITRQRHYEKIGTTGTRKHTAPQEQRLLTIESDTRLQELKDSKALLDDLMKVISDDVKNIIICRHKHNMSWYKIGARLYIDEATARRKYKSFKIQLRELLFISEN